jgi:hypothetical protein
MSGSTGTVLYAKAEACNKHEINYILNLMEKNSSLLIKYKRTPVTNNKANYDSLLFFQFSPLLPCCHSYFLIKMLPGHMRHYKSIPSEEP